MALGDLFSDSNEKQAANTVDKGYKKGYKTAKKELGKGFKGLKNDYAKAMDSIATGADTSLGYYDGFQPGIDAASGLYSDAIGVNGAAGNARAEGAFTVSPGYEFQVNQGLDALDRRAASRGMLASGNNSIDTINYSQGVANQEYGNWLNRLAGQQELGVGIAGAQAGITTGAATQNAAIRTGLGDVKMGLGERKADLGYATRLGRAGVEADYLAGKDGTGANIVGAVTGGASLGAKLLGAG
jgi:hypothetical protein